MDAQEMVLLGIAAVGALCGHIFVRRFFVACALCVAVETLACLGFLGSDFIRLRLPPSKFFWVPFILVVQGVYAFLIGVGIGLPFYLVRRRNRLRGDGP